MRYLVLGSHGQLGSSLMQVIGKKGDEAIAFDIAHSSDEDLRIANNLLLRERMKLADFVMFLAFDVGGSIYLQQHQHSVEFLSNNMRIMENTFAMLKELRKPFIFASSQMSNMTYSPYGLLKALGEAYTKALNGLIVKFWNVYGMEKDLEKSHVITDLLLKVKSSGKVSLLTDGSEKRQFLYVDDCSECLLALADHYVSIPRDRDLHITNFAWNSILDVAKIISKLHQNAQIELGEGKDFSQRYQRNEPDPFILNYWKPKISLEKGISFVSNSLLTEHKSV